MEINKELIKSVLAKETENLSDNFIFSIKDNYILFVDEGECQFEVNIYEFAFKCKEWAYKNDYSIWSVSWGAVEFCNIKKYNGTERIVTKSETEAIIKACNWILEQQK